MYSKIHVIVEDTAKKANKGDTLECGWRASNFACSFRHSSFLRVHFASSLHGHLSVLLAEPAI